MIQRKLRGNGRLYCETQSFLQDGLTITPHPL